MGIIIRQSLKQSIVTTLALIIAAVAQLFIYTLDESKTYGLAQQILAIVMLAYPILLFGVPQALIKFFEANKDSEKGYLANFLVLASLLFAFALLIYWIFEDAILQFLEGRDFDSSLLTDYGLQIMLLIFCLMMFKIISVHMSTHQRIVWPSIFEGLWTKVALAILVLLVIQGYLDIKLLSWGIVAYYAIGLFGIIIYAAYLGKLDLRFNKELFKNGGITEIGRYSAYTGLAVFGATFAMRIDAFMVATLTNEQLTGVYMLFLFLAGVIDIPARAVAQISGPIISQANAKGDIAEIEVIYSKAANTLFLAAIAVFALIALSMGDLFALTKKGDFYSEYFILFGILGLIKIIPTTLATVNQIILYSKYYRVVLYLTLLIGLINVILNYHFIKTVFQDQPLTGVCLATAISIGVHYLLMVVFVKIKFGIQPIRLKMGLSLLVSMVCFGAAVVIPSTGVHIINIGLKSLVFILPFIYLIYTFKISSDINNLIDQTIVRIKNQDFKNLF